MYEYLFVPNNHPQTASVGVSHLISGDRHPIASRRDRNTTELISVGDSNPKAIDVRQRAREFLSIYFFIDTPATQRTQSLGEFCIILYMKKKPKTEENLF